MFRKGLLYVTPAALGIQLFDPMQIFSWGIYVGATVVYTALAFGGELSNEGPLIFSKQNARSVFLISAIHMAFLAILFGLMRFGPLIYPFLPGWMTDRFDVRGSLLSALDFIFVLAMIGLSHVERRWLFVEADAGSDIPQCDSSEFRKR